MSVRAPLEPWSTAAVNLPEHADNPVHTDEGARAAGFERAIVAGTTVHAYLTHPVAAAWGSTWVRAGWSEVRFRAPVFDGDEVVCRPSDSGIEATVGDAVRATLAIAPTAPAVGPQLGERLPSVEIDLSTGPGTYGLRAGDDLALYAELGIAHPVVWSVIGNTITNTNCVDGPWVHVRSAITHLDTVPADAIVEVESTLKTRFESRAGERVVLDVRAMLDGCLLAVVEHESIVRLADN